MASQIVLCAPASTNLKQVARLYDICTPKPYDLSKNESRLHRVHFPPCVRTLSSFFACPPQIRASITLDHPPPVSRRPVCPRLGYADGFAARRVRRVLTTLTFWRRRPFGWNINCSSVSRAGYNTSHDGGPTLSRSLIERLAALWILTRGHVRERGVKPTSDSPSASRETSMVNGE